MAQNLRGDSSPDTDRDFEPNADLMVHDYDDEQTLDEEEGLSNSDAGSNELDALKNEGDMPMEDLMAMYGYSGGSTAPVQQDPESRASSSEEEILSNQDLTLDKDEIARDLLKGDDDSNKETSVTDLFDSVEMEIQNSSETHRLLRSANNPDCSEDDSEDTDYQPVNEEDWKKTISVGSDFQAIPPPMQKYGDAPPYENEDRLLWDPAKRDLKEVEAYLAEIQASVLANAQGLQAIPQGVQVKDDDQALYLLHQCGNNIEEAMRRRKIQAVPSSDPMSLWSEEECRNFESGLQKYGKNFTLIQQNKVRTRSCAELVDFYYLWKKTERHDEFTNKSRLEKKKYALHPGVTDYMDRFLDEQEDNNPVVPQLSSTPRERSSSPSCNSLIYGDPKRHHHQQQQQPTTPTLNNSQVDLPTIVEMVQKMVHPQELERLSSELDTSATSAATLPGATPVLPMSDPAGANIHDDATDRSLPNFTATPPASAIPTAPSPPSTPPDMTSEQTSRKREAPRDDAELTAAPKRHKAAGDVTESQHSNGLQKASNTAVAAVSSLIDSVQVAIAGFTSSSSSSSSQAQQSSSGPPAASTSPPVAAGSD